MQTKTIIRLGCGWYDFTDIPQGYIRVDSLHCLTDKKALKQAKKLNPEFEYIIKEQSQIPHS